jgi:hypothetical protein
MDGFKPSGKRHFCLGARVSCSAGLLTNSVGLMPKSVAGRWSRRSNDATINLRKSGGRVPGSTAHKLLVKQSSLP